MTGKVPIKLKWVDTRKSTGEVRSRLVAKEFKKDHRPETFSATPPLEAMKLLISLVASSQECTADWGVHGEAEPEFKARGRGESQESWTDAVISLLHIDVSRAYFHAPAKEAKYVEIPAEDWEADRADMGQCGRLNVSLYGTRDAARNWGGWGELCPGAA